MITITPDTLRDFQLCRYLYKRRHVDGIAEIAKPNRDQLPTLLDEGMQKLVRFFYFQCWDKGVPGFGTVEYQWQKIWFGSMTAEDIMSGSDTPDKNINAYNTKAIKMIRRFYEMHRNNPGEVVFLNEPYSIQLAPDTMVEGSIDLAIKRNNQIILPHYTTKTSASFKVGTTRWYKMVLDAMAFRAKVDRLENSSRIMYLDSGKMVDVAVSDLEIRQVSELADEMATATRFPASNGCYWCRSCRFDTECKSW